MAHIITYAPEPASSDPVIDSPTAKIGYVASYTTPDGRGAAVLDLRTPSSQAAASPEFRALAQEICQVLACRAPRYLTLDQIPEEERQAVRRECLRTALARGIPDRDLEEYAAQLARQRLAELCLMELPLRETTVRGAVEELARKLGHPVQVVRYYRVSVDDP
jgi:elongation factor Ts